MKVVKAPNQYSRDTFSIFLAGSIEMGVAEDWQTQVTEQFAMYENVTRLNPRRDEWDSSWEQRMHNPQFCEQVTWELDALSNANVIIMYFSPGTKSPISLLELGLFVDSNIFVCCPDDFWRKGNVEIVCDRFGIPLFDDLDTMVNRIKDKYRHRLDLI